MNNPPTFLMKHDPWEHQERALNMSHDQTVFGLLMAMRTGKTKVIIDNAVHLYRKNIINALVVVAPNGVHRNWVVKEIPTHIPDGIPVIPGYWVAQSKKADRVRWDMLWKGDSLPLRVFTFNYDALNTKKGREEITKVLNTFSCMFALDESQRIKHHTTSWTKVLLKLAPKALFRRILTGTSITQSPLDLYTQFAFMDPAILGHSTFTSFKNRYCVIEVQLKTTGHARLKEYCKRKDIIVSTKNPPKDILWKAGCKGGRDYFENTVDMQHMEELKDAIRPYCIVVRREDAGDMPDVVRERVVVELTTDQRRIYDELLEHSAAELGIPIRYDDEMSVEDRIFALVNGADKVIAKNAMGKVLRLQQVIGGHVPDENGELRHLENNRVVTLMDRLLDIEGKVIVWARFRPELAELEEAIAAKYGPESVVAYHGGVDGDSRTEAVRRLDEDPACRYFVGNPQSGGIGLPLHAADTLIYYSNDYNAETRQQSEERATQIGKHKILCLDMEAEGTVDTKILQALDDKKAVADNFFADF